MGELLGWAVCANISDVLRGGVDPQKFYQGTRMFSPGTRVYLGRVYWGMGGESLHVVGLRRISRDFVNCVIAITIVENIRICSVYSPKLWNVMARLEAETFSCKQKAASFCSTMIDERDSSLIEKLKPETRSGPWGEYTVERYRNKDC